MFTCPNHHPIQTNPQDPLNKNPIQTIKPIPKSIKTLRPPPIPSVRQKQHIHNFNINLIQKSHKLPKTNAVITVHIQLTNINQNIYNRNYNSYNQCGRIDIIDGIIRVIHTRNIIKLSYLYYWFDNYSQ